MSIPKKGSRKIVVEGNSYRWIVRDRPTYTQAFQGGKMLAAIELDSQKGSTLSVEFKWLRPDVAITSYPNSVMPKLIGSCIKSAINEGWNPINPGPAYNYYCKLDQHRANVSN
ncbi:hypothetical protein ACJJI5_03955 [Microbulbifer sp. EKSA008]|uniref:hypothetical protein n=1 Tax=Microbulbifer sp. EKSA008 TaxID=3243367 RepID=UPI0040435544